MKYHIPLVRHELAAWIEGDSPVSVVASELALDVARKVAESGWRERARERRFDEPTDMAGSCKFVSLFVKSVFGGLIKGNYDHQYNVVRGSLVDLNQDASDVLNMKLAGYPVYWHDGDFFGSCEHLDSLLSCAPRSNKWAKTFMLVWNCSSSMEVADLLIDRFEYLERLRYLTSGWISSGSIAMGEVPSEASIELAKDMLSTIADSAESEKQWNLKRVILGPLISGGISLEATTSDNQFSVIINCANTGKVDFSFRDDEEWSEYEVSAEHASEHARTLLARPVSPRRAKRTI